MTAQLLILGNGFDLQCGLQSSYKSFFRQEILDITTESFGIIQLKPGVTGFWENLLLEYRKINEDEDYKWCVVETIIKDTLWRIYYGESKHVTDINNGFGMQAIECEKFYSINECLEDISDPIDKYIMRYCFRFFDRLGPEYKYISDLEKLTLLFERLLQELTTFERRFCKYLKGILNNNYIISAVDLLATLTGFSKRKYEVISDIIDDRKKLITNGGEARYEKGLTNDFSNLKSTYILSFNYTSIFDLLKIKSPCHYNNVHGKLCNEDCSEGCASSNIIFGIDDKIIQSQDEYNDLRIFSKTYRKMSATNAPERILPKNDELVDIIFYGHSLSEADYSYFQSIFDYYNLYSNNSVSLHFYYSENYNPTDAVYRLINEYGKTLTNKDQGKNLMHKLLLENRLKIAPIF